jgi:hypothetical protein
MAYYLFSIIAFLSSCHQEDNSSLSNLYITFKVDSTKIYDAKIVPKGIFIFSPIQYNDKIWTLNTMNPHELDLKTGEWSPLTLIFGNDLKRQIREDRIWRDKYTGETYISCFHDGLIRYLPEKDIFAFLKTYPVTAFYPRKNNIVLGTANGLYFLNRNENEIIVAENFPLDIWVNSIQESNNDTLLLNSKYYYHITSNAFGEKDISISESEKRTNYNYVSQDIQSKLSALGGGFREFISDSLSWYYREGELFYSGDKNVFYKFHLFPEEYIWHILEDKEYLYVLFHEQFVIFNKEYIFKNSIYHDVENYQELQKELWQKMIKLDESILVFDKYLANSITLFNEEKYSGYSGLKNTLENIPKRFEDYRYELGVENLNLILEDGTIPEIFKYNILKGLCRKHTTSAELDSALIYFKLIEELYPSYKDECIDFSYPCVKKAYNRLDSIRNEDTSADRLLFLEAKTRQEMIHCCCWFGNSSYDYSIVEEKYQEILTNHPNSEYADDAEFWMINYRNYDGEEGGYPVDAIPTIREFVNKYPNSNLIPELLINIAHSYTSEYSEDIDDRIRSVELSIDELKALLSNYQLDSLEFARVEHNLRQFDHQRNKLIYSLTVVPLQSHYKLNEDIEVEIIISNNSSTSISLELFKNESYVSFGIHPDNKVRFIPEDDDDSTKMGFIITRGEPLRQKIKLNKLVRHWDGGTLGRFSFEEGLYYLTCFSREHGLSSEQVKIIVRK